MQRQEGKSVPGNSKEHHGSQYAWREMIKQEISRIQGQRSKVGKGKKRGGLCLHIKTLTDIKTLAYSLSEMKAFTGY